MGAIDLGSMSQWAKNIGWAGLGGLITWLWGLRKTSAEIRKLKAETQAVTRQEKLKDAVILLRRQAGEQLTITNVAILSKEHWASCLPDPSLIDEALAEVGAERTPGKAELWEIRLSAKRELGRWRRY